MTSLEKNVLRLFDNGGKLFLVALDHPLYFGALPGLENTFETAEKLLDSPADGFILSPGVAYKLPADEFYRKKIVLRVSGAGSKFGGFPNFHPVFIDPVNAISLGADAVIVMMVIGGEDVESIERVGRTIWEYHRFGIPVIVEVLPYDADKASDTDLTATGARIASELGADVVKVFYTPNFEKVVSEAGCKVLLAGGPKSESIEDIAKRAVEAGVDGFAFGRNIFSSDDPVDLIGRLDNILRG